MVLKTVPPFVSMAARRRASWRERARHIVSGCSSQSLVEPSISVKRKVSVPVGRFMTGSNDRQVGCSSLFAGKRQTSCPEVRGGCGSRLCKPFSKREGRTERPRSNFHKQDPHP